MTEPPTTPPDTATPDPMGRRERKRLATRRRLADAALTLFARHGYDEVTVADIAEHADVDPGTFFRHFGTKEAVLFTDMADFQHALAEAILARPATEPLFDSLTNALRIVSADMPFDPELELLRSTLRTGSAALAAQSLVHREELVDHLKDLIAARTGLDPATDLYPDAAARLWVTAFEWYGRRTIAEAKAPTSLDQAIDDIVAALRPIWPQIPAG